MSLVERWAAGIPAWLWWLLAGGIPLLFAAITGDIWEDFFITFRCSLNLAQGNGLVYEVGRTLHVFTSPLGVLIPAGIAWGLGTDDAILVLWVFRFVSAVILVAAWCFAHRSLAGSVTVAIAGLMWVLDPKLTAFAMNGMETGLMVFFVVLSWHAVVERRFTLAGIALAGTLWTRPDGFVFFTMIAVAGLLLPGGPRPTWREISRVALIGGLLYLPWFVWAWSYYGSPIPNTILAKSGVATTVDRELEALWYPLDLLLGSTANHEVFLPGYYYFGGWPRAIIWFGKFLTLVCIVPAFWPRCARPSRIAAIAFGLGGFYLELTTRAPWYYPPWAVLGYLSFAGLVPALMEKARTVSARAVITGATCILMLIQAALFVSVTRQLQQQQRIIEWGLRAEIGRDLADWSRSPKDTVFLEPLGYIGYFSGLAMRDTPGLSSPEVIEIGREGYTRMPEIIPRLKPDWVVMRIAEWGRFSEEERAELDRTYAFKREYSAQDEIEAVDWLPGRGFLQFDARFGVWQRLPEP